MASRIAIRAGGEEEETGVREPINNQQLLPHICQDPERAETLCLKMLLLLGGVLLPSSGFGALCMMLSKSRLQGLETPEAESQIQCGAQACRKLTGRTTMVWGRFVSDI